MLDIDLNDLLAAGEKALAEKKKAKKRNPKKRTAAYVENFHKGSLDIESIQAADDWNMVAVCLTVTHQSCNGCGRTESYTSSGYLTKFQHKRSSSVVYRAVPLNLVNHDLKKQLIDNDISVDVCRACF